ncbi:MAG: aminotransferase class I and II [Deltaproteobacteria bacterium]|nr:aminotransferase class I and II [Deltaproteobacteria bacterium]
MRTVVATRYVTPLREGGSLPAIVEGDDQGLYVVKFRGAGQGPKALVAEWVAGELARAAGLQVPELVRVEVSPALGRNEPDGEIRDLLRASAGENLGLDYLPGSVTFDPAVEPAPGGGEASEVVWFDALVQNVDRTPRNPNLLLWHRRLWLIDHGAALYFHHDWARAAAAAASPFPQVKEHVLLRWADDLPGAGARLVKRLGPEVVGRILAALPDAWLPAEPLLRDPAAHRAAYAAQLARRLAAAPTFVEEAVRARAAIV